MKPHKSELSFPFYAGMRDELYDTFGILIVYASVNLWNETWLDFSNMYCSGGEL